MVNKTTSTIFALAMTLSACQSYSPTTASTSSTPIKLPQGMELLKDSSADADGLTIPYKKYRLANGLTVILHEDHSDPLVHVDVTYHVGSSRETPGRSGFAHFFEHMMFQGSENVADEQHFKMITEAGGSMNGTTNSDRTNYYQTVPANQLEKVLWLEADRMGFLLGAVTQQKFEVQRETVKNERAQRVDNQPYGLRSERVAEALYPADHPYHWPVIGYVEDLNRVDVNDLKSFFRRWYGPNNAVLTIGGDIDETQTLAWINKYFAAISRGEKVDSIKKTPILLEQERNVTLEDRVHLPLLQLTFPTVYARHEDEAPLDVLADILGGGKTSLLYKNLVKDGWAVHAGVGHPCRELACQFEFIALPNPQRVSSLAELRNIIDTTLKEFEERGVSNDDLLRTKAAIRSGTVFGLQSVAGKVSQLASNQVFASEPDLLSYDIARYDSVTKEDVLRVYHTYIKDKASVNLSIVPQGQIQMQAREPDFTRPERLLTVSSEVSAESKATKDDDFDRSQVPATMANKAVPVPEFWQKNLKNGVPLMVHESQETPTVTMLLSLEGGPLLDPLDKAGLAAITSAMLSESTQNYSNEAMANAMAKLGSSISFNASGRFTTISVSSLQENFEETLTLLQEKLFRPGFQQADFERLKNRVLQSIQQSYQKPEVRSGRAISDVLYGSNNRVSLPDNGTLETVANISLQDVKDFYQQYYSASKASVVVVGNVKKAELLQKLSFLGAWQKRDYQLPGYQPFPQLDEPTLYLVDHPGAAQSIVTLTKRTEAYDAVGAHFKSNLVNFPFGGAFNSRINLNLREDKGYTYGVRSGFSAGKTLGRFQLGGAFTKQHTVAALEELMTEINEYQAKGMTEQEHLFMRNAYTQGDALKYETPASKAGFMRHLSVYQLTPDFTAEQKAIIEDIPLTKLNELAAEIYDSRALQVVVVADLNSLGDELRAWAKRQDRKVVLLQQ